MSVRNRSGAPRGRNVKTTTKKTCPQVSCAGPFGSCSICSSSSRRCSRCCSETCRPARDFWTEFSVAIGYAGLAMMGLQFGLTARFRYVTEPWGEDVIYHFHRQISLIAVGLVVAHPIIFFVVRPQLLALLNFIAGAAGALASLSLSTCSLIALVVMALGARS